MSKNQWWKGLPKEIESDIEEIEIITA